MEKMLFKNKVLGYLGKALQKMSVRCHLSWVEKAEKGIIQANKRARTKTQSLKGPDFGGKVKLSVTRV